MPQDPPHFRTVIALEIVSHRAQDVALYGPKGSGRPELEMSPEAERILVFGSSATLRTFCLCRVSVNPLMTGQHVKIVTRRWPRPAAGDPTTMEDSNGGAA